MAKNKVVKEESVVENVNNNINVEDLLKQVEELKKENEKLKQKKIDFDKYCVIKVVAGASAFEFYTDDKNKIILEDNNDGKVYILKEEAIYSDKNKSVANRIVKLSSKINLI